MSKWISVKDQLPEEGRYLAWPNTVGEAGTALYWPKNNRWQDLEDHTEPWTPTHWMPLPEPPKEQGEDIPSSKFKHLCPEWDFMEIDEKDPEFDACLCFRKEELEPPKEGE